MNVHCNVAWYIHYCSKLRHRINSFEYGFWLVANMKYYEFPHRSLRRPKTECHISRSLLVTAILRHLKAVHAILVYFYKIIFILFSHLCRCLATCYLPLIFRMNRIVNFSLLKSQSHPHFVWPSQFCTLISENYVVPHRIFTPSLYYRVLRLK